jgi:hypothetical protein
VLNEKEKLLEANRTIEPTTGTVASLKAMLELYDTELTKINEEELRISKATSKLQELESSINNQLQEQNKRKILPTSEIEIRVETKTALNAAFSITYLVSNAGWYPKYDVRVTNITKPLQLTYKAEVFQNTGVDWTNVRLRFSNGRPNQNGVTPKLDPWLLTYARNTISRSADDMALMNLGMVKGIVTDAAGEPIPGANVLVKGTTIGTTTDAGGRYSLTLPHTNATLVVSFVGYTSHETIVTQPEMNMQLNEDAQQLNEVMVTGYGITKKIQGKVPGVRIRGMSSLNRDQYNDKGFLNTIKTTVIENQTTVEIEVDDPYSIPSDGEKLMVDLRNYDIPAQFEYFAVPKLDKDAFLVARILDWDQYNLLEGETNLYFEDAFIGRSILHTKALTDTLTISLGRDKNIVIGRTPVEQFTKKQFLGTNKAETRAFKIQIRNKKTQPIQLTIYDQIPVALLGEIEVNAIKLSGGTLEAKTGQITWKETIQPQHQKELTFEYEVRYPKREDVILE